MKTPSFFIFWASFAILFLILFSFDWKAVANTNALSYATTTSPITNKIKLEKAEVPASLQEIPWNKLVNLTDEKSKLSLKSQDYDLIVVDFWASWCMPCLQSLPYYESLITKSKKKIKLIAVSIDSTEKMALSFKSKLKDFKTELYWDKDKALKPYFSVEVLPYMFIYDKHLNYSNSQRGFDLEKKQKVYEGIFL